MPRDISIEFPKNVFPVTARSLGAEKIGNKTMMLINGTAGLTPAIAVRLLLVRKA
jgi:hypothetical protein